jgi:hypothetical protein
MLPTRPLSRQIICCAFIAAALLLARVPFIHNLLVGEEGCVGFLVANPTPASELTAQMKPQCLIGNVGGKLEFVEFERTIVPYRIIESIAGTVTRPLQILDMTDADARTRTVRLAFLALFAIGVAGAVWMAAKGGLVSALIVLYALTTPLAVGASIQPQVDGSVGVLLLGLAGWLLVSSKRPAAIFIAGLLVGLGRHEWSLALLGATSLIFAVGFITRTSNIQTTGPILLGVSAGIALSLSISFSDYINGFGVMRRVTGLANPLVLAERFAIYLVPTALLLAAAALLGLRQARGLLARKPGTLVALVAGGAILVGFGLSGWPGDGFPRYYTPALVLATYAVLSLIHENGLSRPASGLATGALILGLGFNINYLWSAARQEISITSSPGLNLVQLRKKYDETAAWATRENILPMEHAGFWLYYPNSPFFSRDMGVPGSIAYLKQHHPSWVDKLRDEPSR